MRSFFSQLDEAKRQDPQRVALAYGKHLLTPTGELRDMKRHSKSRFYVGLSARLADFEDLTKRVTLISDTLLLSHDWSGSYHEIGKVDPTGQNVFDHIVIDPMRSRYNIVRYGMYCPDLYSLGLWILRSEPLLTAGLTWYLPNYSTSTSRVNFGPVTQPRQPTEHMDAIDYLIRDGRAIDASGAHPVKSRLVRPVLEMEIPFIEGVDLKDFSRITVEEFDSYQAFRSFLGRKFLNFDDAMNAEQSDAALAALGREIESQVLHIKADMESAQRTRAVSAAGAFVGTVAATLVAVYAPALQYVLTIVGGGGGIWGAVSALAADANTRRLKKNEWHYVWVLQRSTTGRSQ